jgi:hypothetical protein
MQCPFCLFYGHNTEMTPDAANTSYSCKGDKLFQFAHPLVKYSPLNDCFSTTDDKTSTTFELFGFNVWRNKGKYMLKRTKFSII